jgi:monooxygenase
MAADFAMKTADDAVTVVELLRAGRPLFLDLGERADLLRIVRPWADRVALVRATAEHDAEALLVRPDGYVVWSSDAGADALTGALHRWFGVP